MAAYYSENDPYAASWLRNLITAKLIPAGDVDDRDIRDVHPDDLRGYAQQHFFAGVGGWAYAARLAGWPDDRALCTGSCPCQPFSVAGRGKGADDERHLWPDFFRLIRAVRPAVIMGEQVAGAAGYGWLDGVRADLAGEGYASRGVDIPACAVDAPHIRSRLYWIAVADAERPGFHGYRSRAVVGSARTLQANGAERQRVRIDHGQYDDACGLGDADVVRRLQSQGCVSEERGRVGDANARGVGFAERERPPAGHGGAGDRSTSAQSERSDRGRGPVSTWARAEWIGCHDGRSRRAHPGAPLLVAGIPDRVALWRGFGNAIVAPLAAEVIAAFMECAP